ncbi:hypothetical protein B0J13DRAFT_41152 [Dactylonectria estremocensis]|uniref:Wax synthase domain-containing protein n=1 Tax=Dactylonectria estremocensis TaxID=1079267 RepID=A0A9P9ESQ4_9HYPO|nr:hypothetical protein B0J13DRAFT_41152 [Dactylonectria estremocensis]
MSTHSSPLVSCPSLRDVIPFVTLPLLVLFAFACPPFRGRGICFVTLIILTDYATVVSPWPPNAGSTRPMRYGMAGSWLFVLPAIERLLLHEPERDFWRLDEEKLTGKGQPPEWTWRKLRWALDLAATPRAVGWNFGSRKLNATRQAIRLRRPTRTSFVVTSLARAALVYLTLDAVILIGKTADIDREWAWAGPTIASMSLRVLLMGLSVYSSMALQFEIAAGISVGLGISQPEDWPPLFGSIADGYTVANVWGKVWHGYIRQPVLGFGHATVDSLRVPKGSAGSYFIHLYVAFLISSFFHILGLFMVSEGYLSTRNLIQDMSFFFLAQPPVTMIETFVLRRCQAYVSALSPSDKEIQQVNLVSLKTKQRLLRALGYTVGYCWVVSWFTFTGWWFVKDYIAIGVLEWPLPFSFCEAAWLEISMKSHV